MFEVSKLSYSISRSYLQLAQDEAELESISSLGMTNEVDDGALMANILIAAVIRNITLLFPVSSLYLHLAGTKPLSKIILPVIYCY